MAAGAGWFPVVQPAGLTDATGAAASAAPAACEVGVAQRRTGTYNAHWPSGAAATRPRSGAGCTSTPRDSTPWSAPRPNGLDKPWTLVAAELDDPPPASYDDPGGPGRPTDARGRTATRPEEGLRPGPVGETGRRPITAGGPCLWAGGADPSVLASAHLRPATSGPGMPGSVLRRVGHGSNRSDQYGRVCGTPAINSPCCSDANHDTHPPQSASSSRGRGLEATLCRVGCRPVDPLREQDHPGASRSTTGKGGRGCPSRRVAHGNRMTLWRAGPLRCRRMLSRSPPTKTPTRRHRARWRAQRGPNAPTRRTTWRRSDLEPPASPMNAISSSRGSRGRVAGRCVI